MTAPDPRVGEIEARLSAHYESVAYEDDIAEGCEELFPEDYERHYCADDGKDWPCPDVTDYAQEDIRYLLAELRKAHEALARVEVLCSLASKRGIESGPPLELTALRAAVAAANGDGRNHVPETEWGTDHWGEVLSEPTEGHARGVARITGANVYHRSPMGQWIKEESE